jgi:glycosyltransferase involved in cell wall biosynthesis
MKKIVHIVESFGGGVYSYLLDLTSGLVDEYEVYILYGVRDQTPKDLKKQFNKKVKLIKIKNFTRNLNVKKDFKAYLEIKRELRKINPDIVHFHSSKAGGIGRIIKYDKKQKLFYTPHGYAFLDESQNSIKSKIYLFAEKFLGKRNVLTIACSNGEYLQSKRVTNNSIFINNSVDTNFLKRFRKNHSNSVDTIFTIGRISEQKNPRLFNDIARKNLNKKFVWIGDGPLRKELVSSNILVTGWMSREEVLKKIQPYKYFILTSKWEGLPISLLESMYFSKICFVTDTTGNNDVIDDNINGYLFKTTKEFERKFDERKELKEDPHTYIVNHFSKDEMIRKYKEVYSSRK